jgi:monoterpene epsilon-lactone hydrolase
MPNPALDTILAMLHTNTLDLSDPVAARPQFEAMFADVPLPAGISVEPGHLGDIPGLWLQPANAPRDQVILYLHGGAYVIGSAKSYTPVAAGLAATAGTDLFIPDYRLAPEHPYPAACDDVLSCYQTLLHQRDVHVSVAGDSAGGGLVLSLLLNARRFGLPQPSCAVLWSPWLDLGCKLPAYTRNAAVDPTLDAVSLLACVKDYAGARVPQDECLHPLEAYLGGLAPLLLQVGSTEVLLDDTMVLAQRAIAHGVHCQLEVWPGMPHVWQGFAPALVEGTKALVSSAQFIKRFAR